MFFRREKPQIFTFRDRLEQLRRAGYSVVDESAGRARVSNAAGCAAVLEEKDGQVRVGKSGFLRGDEIAHLVSGGYQMFLRTPSGKTEAAQASQLKALHAFDEDVREIIGAASLYNEGLGTTSEEHLYDRVVNRDRGVPKRPWQRG
jgi:hypothetical protein